MKHRALTHATSWSGGITGLGLAAILVTATGCFALANKLAREPVSSEGKAQAEALVTLYHQNLTAVEKLKGMRDHVFTTEELAPVFAEVSRCFLAGQDYESDLELDEIPRKLQLDTQRGNKTTEEIKEECRQLFAQISELTAVGCGVKVLEVTKSIQGDGTWTEPTSWRGEKYWTAVPCAKVERISAGGIAPEGRKLARLCGANTSFATVGWSEKKNHLGVIVEKHGHLFCYLERVEQADWRYPTWRQQRRQGSNEA